MLRRNPGLVLSLIAFFVVISSVNANDNDTIEDDVENLNCFQNGRLIAKTTVRIRNFRATDDMVLIADVNVGKLSEDHIKLYVSKYADVVCVVTVGK